MRFPGSCWGTYTCQFLRLSIQRSLKHLNVDATPSLFSKSIQTRHGHIYLHDFPQGNFLPSDFILQILFCIRLRVQLSLYLGSRLISVVGAVLSCTILFLSGIPLPLSFSRVHRSIYSFQRYSWAAVSLALLSTGNIMSYLPSLVLGGFRNHRLSEDVLQ